MEDIISLCLQDVTPALAAPSIHLLSKHAKAKNKKQQIFRAIAVTLVA